MAKWRAIHASITTDGKVNRMSEFAQNLYVRLVVKADDWGVIAGDTFELKGETIPLSSRNFQEIEDALQEMVPLNLIWRYEEDGFGPLVQVRKFDEHQPGATVSKRTEPKLPLHPDWRPTIGDTLSVELLQEALPFIPSLSKILQELPVNGVLEESRGEEKREDKNRGEEERRRNFSQIWIEKMGQLIDGGLAERIDAWMEDISEEWFVAACDEAVDHDARTWAYVKKILENWRAGGRHAKRGKRDTTKAYGFNEAAERQAEQRKVDAG